MFPNLIKITERAEESVHETLALSLPKILTILSCFTTENEMKVNLGKNTKISLNVSLFRHYLKLFWQMLGIIPQLLEDVPPHQF